MKVVYNGKVLNDNEVNINFHDRGFLYGDGFFETFFYSKNKIPHYKFHHNRIQEAFIAYGFNPEHLPGEKKIMEYIIKICTLNNYDKSRVKMIFWRKEGGLYNTSISSFNYLITTSILDPIKSNNKTACFQTQGANVYSDFSPFKPLSGYKYIHAGLELNKSSFEEIILLSASNNISETLYSNIFWGTDNLIYTPSLRTGCITGIMRKLVIQYFENLNISVIETEATKSELLNAEFVFTTNSLGIHSISQIENKKFKKFTLINKLMTELITKYLN